MMKAIKVILVLLLIIVIGFLVWGYAPDRDVAEPWAEHTSGRRGRILIFA